MPRPVFTPADPNKATQAGYARHRGVAPSTATVWRNRGLLVIDEEGLIDVAASDRRLAERPATYRGGSINPAPVAPGEDDHSDDARVLGALVALVGSIEAIVAAAAVDSGATLKTAFATATFAAVGACEIAEDILDERGIDVRGRAVWPAPGAGPLAPNWKAIAARCGERLNLTALQAHVVKLQADDE